MSKKNRGKKRCKRGQVEQWIDARKPGRPKPISYRTKLPASVPRHRANTAAFDGSLGPEVPADNHIIRNVKKGRSR